MEINNLITDKLERYCLGTCTSKEAFEVEEWMASIDKKEEDMAAINALFERIEESNDSMADKAFNKCSAALNIGPKKSHRRLYSWIYAACAIGVGFVLGLAMHPSQETKADVTYKEVYAQRGSSQKVTLPDGSVILLKSGSRLIYPTEFSKDGRHVYLSGECYASVIKNPDWPLIMSTGLMNVRVTGTEFNIKSFPEDSEAEVVLLDGSVQLEGNSESPISLSSIVLTPGNVVKVDRKNGKAQISRFDTSIYDKPEDNSKNFVFLDRKFCDIVSELSRALDVNIVLDDKALGEKRFYASFINGEDLMEMLSTFNADESMVIKKDGETIMISKPRI